MVPMRWKDHMKQVIGEPSQEERIDTFLEGTSVLVDFLSASTPIKLTPNPYYADMYPEMPGAAMQYRAHEPDPIDGALLGDDVHTLRPQHPQTTLFGSIGWTANDATVLQTRAPGWVRTAVGLVARYFLDLRWRLKTRRDRHQVLGGALVAGLCIAATDREIPLWLSSPAGELLQDQGRVVGVILASGGFEMSPKIRGENLPGSTSVEWSAGSPGNTGDMLVEAGKLGAGNWLLDEAWWGPTVALPGEPQARMLIIEKNLPGLMMVNIKGERFVNESSSYTKVVKGMLTANKAGAESVPACFIFDAQYRHKFPCGPLYPASVMPDFLMRSKIRSWVCKADTLDELASQLGVDPDGLVATAKKMNSYAINGKDLDFNRGDSTYDRMYGDQNTHPNPCLGPISKPPFYGVRVYPGDLGTKGGMKTDACARVLAEDGQSIEGLYAIGNCAGSVMGRTYLASGSTLVPAMIFGLIATDHIAGGS